MADIANVCGESERGRAFGLTVEQRWTVEVVVPIRTRPDRRDRDHMREVQRGDRRLADIGVKMAGQGAQPRFERVQGFGDAGEIAPLHDLLCCLEICLGRSGVFVPDGNRGGDVSRARHVRAQFLQRFVGICRLVGRITVEQGRGFVGHHLFQDRCDGLALGEPLPADAGEHPGGICLVEADRARAPAILETLRVQLVE